MFGGGIILGLALILSGLGFIWFRNAEKNDRKKKHR